MNLYEEGFIYLETLIQYIS